MAKAIMIQGTMSSVGKSLLCAGLCRVFRQDGCRVAPFKSQNMSSYSFTDDAGLQMSRAQAAQAEAAGLVPDIRMNPILLKPVSHMGSEVFVSGKSRGLMKAAEYHVLKPKLIPEILAAYHSLSKEQDIIVIEGAGSPAEINLKENDIVNMGLARLIHTPVLLVGDIDRGGVFAQLSGTITLLEKEERHLIKGLIINKFRGDISLLEPGLSMLESLTGKKVIGTLPMLDVDIEEEDSQSEGMRRQCSRAPASDGKAYKAYRSNQYDLLAAAIRQHLNMPDIYRILEEG